MTDASDPMSEQSPAVSAPYIKPAKFSVKGYRTIDAGTLDISCERPIAHQYSLPATASFRKPDIFSFAAIDD